MLEGSPQEQIHILKKANNNTSVSANKEGLSNICEVFTKVADRGGVFQEVCVRCRSGGLWTEGIKTDESNVNNGMST